MGQAWEVITGDSPVGILPALDVGLRGIRAALDLWAREQRPEGRGIRTIGDPKSRRIAAPLVAAGWAERLDQPDAGAVGQCHSSPAAGSWADRDERRAVVAGFELDRRGHRDIMPAPCFKPRLLCHELGRRIAPQRNAK